MEKHISLEQAQELKALGINQFRFSQYCWSKFGSNFQVCGWADSDGDVYAAFDCAELLQMLPDCTNKRQWSLVRENNKYQLMVHYHAYFTEGGDELSDEDVASGDYGGFDPQDGKWLMETEDNYFDYPAQAIADTIIYGIKEEIPGFSITEINERAKG